MGKRCARIWLQSALLLVSMATAANAEGDQRIARYKLIVQPFRDTLSDLGDEASLAIGVGIAIAVAGVATAALQGWTATASRVLAALLGMSVAGLTVYGNALPEDHRSLRRKVQDGGSLLRQIDGLLEMLAEIPYEERETMFPELDEQIRNLRLLLAPPQVGRVAFEFSWIEAAYAEPVAPSWIHGRGADAENLYFVGFGLGETLAAAREAAELRANTDALAYLTLKLPNERADLAAKLAASATVEDVSFARAKDGTYSYHALLRLNRRGVDTEIQLFEARKLVRLPEAAKQAVTGAQGRAADYYKSRQQVYAQQFRAEQKSLGDDYATFEKARALRRAGENAEAIALLEPFVAKHGDSFLSWFNLALARSMSAAELSRSSKQAPELAQLIAGAEAAYRRAIALEPSQLQRDASIYNSFGHFLLEVGRPSEAKPMFEAALARNPEHSLARANLARAQGAMRAVPR